MNYYFIDKPVFQPRTNYDAAIDYFVEKFKKVDGVKSIIKFGNIKSPGISDLDLLIVFENNVKTTMNGFEGLPIKYAYLFTHGIMAISSDHFMKNFKYTLWHNYTILWGDQLIETDSCPRTETEDRELKVQTALEFLLANYVDLVVHMKYGIIKLRSLMQHVKGLYYDFEYLNVRSGEAYNKVMEMKGWMANWFDLQLGDAILENWLDDFFPHFSNFTKEQIEKYKVYFPPMDRYKVARNIELFSSDTFGFSHKGILLPKALHFLGTKYRNVQNRFNKFDFFLPMKHTSDVSIIRDRFQFLQDMKTYNRDYLSAFMTITTSITSKII